MLNKHRKFIIWPAGAILLVFLYQLGILHPVENIITRFANPFLARLHILSSGFRTAYEEQISKRDYEQIISGLKIDVETLTDENVKLKIVKDENDILREHLGFLERNKYKYVVGNIIAREGVLDSGGQSEAIIIDKGSADGLYPGLSVVSGAGSLVGKIAEVKPSLSRVYLANSSRCKFAATVLDREQTSGIAQGSLGLVIKMDFIPQNVSLAVGDMAVSSGLEESIPRGLIIGKITEIKKENNDLWQSATIAPLADADELIIVSVIFPEEKES